MIDIMKVCENKKIPVLLYKSLKGRGKPGDEVMVLRGFARNSLIPRGIACYSTAENKQSLSAKQLELAREDEILNLNAQKLKTELENVELVFYCRLRDERNIHGSIQTRDIEAELNKLGLNVQKSQISLPKPLKTIDTYKIKIELYGDISTYITVDLRSLAKKPIE